MRTTAPDLRQFGKKKSRLTTKNFSHWDYQDFACNTDRYRFRKYDRVYDIPAGEIKIPKRTPDRYLTSRITLHPDAAPFFFFLSGHTKNLLHYILFFEMEPGTGTFYRNKLMEIRFQEYCRRFDEKPSDETIRKSFRVLVNQNVILNFSRGSYRVNPMIAGGSNDDERRILINEYCSQLLKKGKGTEKDFYPKYTQ